MYINSIKYLIGNPHNFEPLTVPAYMYLKLAAEGQVAYWHALYAVWDPYFIKDMETLGKRPKKLV